MGFDGTGAVVVGNVHNNVAQPQPAIWTPSGWTELGYINGGGAHPLGNSSAVSADGRIVDRVIGHADDEDDFARYVIDSYCSKRQTRLAVDSAIRQGA